MLAIAVAVSSFVALSLVPAAMAKLAAHNPRSRRADALGAALGGFYDRSLSHVLRWPLIALFVCIGAASAAGALYWQLDRELLPSEDRGTLNIFSRGPDGVGLAYVERQGDQLENILVPLIDNGEIASLYTVIGRWDPNIVFINARLVPWDQRERTQQEIAAELKPLFADIPCMTTRIFSGNSLNIRGASTGGISLALLGTDYDSLFASARTYSDAIREQLDSVSRPRVSYDPSQIGRASCRERV